MTDSEHIYKKCGKCVRYGLGRILDYPNTAPEENTWRVCTAGSTVKDKSMACQMFEEDCLA